MFYMGKVSDLKQGIRLAKKLKFRKPLTIDEFNTLRKEGFIKGRPRKISRTKKGTAFIGRIDRLGFI